MKRLLERSGFEVELAGNGAEAETLLCAKEYDVAVIDLVMPEVDGFALMEWMRKNTPSVVPIVLSATSLLEDATRAVREGAFDFVSKPIDSASIFIQHVNRAIQHHDLVATRERLLKELHEKNIELENRLGQLQLAHNVLQSQAVAIQVDLNRALRIQHGLLPTHLPFADRISCGAFYRPMAKVGGDLYDFFALDDQCLALYIADASGHGVSSAMLTVFLKHAIQGAVRSSDGTVRDPGEVLRQLNQTILHEAFGQGVFVSMTYMLLDVETLAIRYSSAGHPPMLLKRRDGAVTRLHHPAPVLGVNPNVLYTTAEGSMSNGDALVLFTDGISEARNAEGELFGEERLIQMMEDSETHAEAFATRIENELQAFHAGSAYVDDATLIIMVAESQNEPFHAHEEEPVMPAATAQRGVKVLTAEQDGHTFISVVGAGSWRESQQILDICDETANSSEKWVILDLTHCTHLDSTFLGVLHNIVTKIAKECKCQFELQNIPPALMREMSSLGLTSVLSHFRPEALSIPESMTPVEGGVPGGEEMGRLLLWAHEALVEADPSNADRFAAVLQVLHDRAVRSTRDGAGPTSEM
jgi:serine phosphatase RsbU (regulator of sigma subunit)/anti-anti-sigma regulatory factor